MSILNTAGYFLGFLVVNIVLGFVVVGLLLRLVFVVVGLLLRLVFVVVGLLLRLVFVVVGLLLPEELEVMSRVCRHIPCWRLRPGEVERYQGPHPFLWKVCTSHY